MKKFKSTITNIYEDDDALELETTIEHVTLTIGYKDGSEKVLQDYELNLKDKNYNITKNMRLKENKRLLDEEFASDNVQCVRLDWKEYNGDKLLRESILEDYYK